MWLSQHGPILFSSLPTLVALNLDDDDDAAVRQAPDAVLHDQQQAAPPSSHPRRPSHAPPSPPSPRPACPSRPSRPMSEDRGSRPHRKLYVANPGSDSDERENPVRPKYPPYPRPPPAPTYSYSRPSTSQPSYLTTENIHPVASNGTHYQQSYPPLSPDSAGSPAAESSTPPPSTPGLQAPSPSVELQTRVESPSKVLSPPDVNYYERTSKETSRKSKFQALIKAPFGGRPRPPDSNSSRRHRTSPTAATPDSYTSPSSASSTIIFVTADSERYVTVSISGAKTAAQIRELILTKLNLFHEDELHPYSIYQTEIGSFAIGEPLSNDKLWALCRDHSDSKGSLKFFVSIASSTVHEPPPPAPPMEYSSSPPVLPPLANINPLRVKRRSRSRNGSISSMSDNVPLDIGYDADLDNPDRDQNKSTPRLPVHQTATIIPSSSAPAGHPPSPRRRPSIVQHARPASPLIQSPEQATPPGQSSERTWSQRKEDGFGIGHGLPPVPATAAPPPPLSPNRPSFSSYEEASGLAVPYSRLLHVRSGSDAGAEREMALRASEVHADAVTKQLRRDSPSSGKLRAEPSRDNLRDRLGRRVFDEDDPSWEPVPTPTASGTRLADDSDRFPTTLSRSTRVPTIARHRPTFPPRPPASQLAPSMQDTRPSTQPRSGRQPIPTNYFVTWKGEEGGRRASPASPSTWGSSSRLAKTSTKSMDNLKLSSSSSSTSRRNAQLPMTRQTGNMPYSPSGLTLSGVPKSYDPPRGSSFAKPLPAQASPHGTSPDFGQSVSSQYVSRGGAYSSNLISPSQDPIPRPQSATGDAVTSPTSRGYPRLQSPHQYGSTLDSGESNRSPRAISPSKSYHSASIGVHSPRGPRPTNSSDRSDRSDIQSGPETSNTTPPRTPISPESLSYDSSQKNVADSPPPSSPDQHIMINNREPEMTLKLEDQLHFSKIIGTGSQGTLVSRTQPPTTLTRQLTPPPALANQNSTGSYGADDDDDDDDSDAGGGTWIVRPENKPVSPRPPLKVQIEDSTYSRTAESISRKPDPPPKDFAPSSYRPPPEPVASRPAPKRPERPESTFIEAGDESWAPRPPAENIYEHLERFFPKHDLDKPVIESSSGDISPTALEPAAALPPPAPVNDDKARIRAKKSIRYVAQEHKKKIDRTSRAAEAPSYANNMLRKRNTKLWGSRLEEVTTGQVRTNGSSTIPESPSGGPTTFKWVRGELIGKGTYGRVYLALNATTGEMIAVKQVELPQTASDKNDSRQHTVVQALKMESETLRDLDHPNIVQYLGFEETPSNLSIFLEYVPGGSVGSCLHKHGKFEDNVTRSFTSQILSGLEYLHSKGILHRDLKADNILVEMSGVCKISDFGISKRTEDMHGGAFTAMQGTVFWMAPEVINTQKGGYNFKIDIWSVGCVVLEMWQGGRPWMGEEPVAVMFKLYQTKQPPPVNEDVHLSEEADDFRRKCFAINPEERPSAAELRKHPYLTLPPGWVFTGFT